MNPTLSMDQVFLSKITEIIEANLRNEKFGAGELSRELGMSRSNINRKLRSLHKNSISQLIQEIRLEKAMEMLQQKVATASEIAFQVGFSSPTYFNKCFHEYYGFPPGEVKKLEEHFREIAKSMPNVGVTKENVVRVNPKKWLIISFLFVFCTLSLIIIVRYIVSQRQAGDLAKLEKSIAVLPFINDSPDNENTYLINGIMVEVLNNLQRIKDFRVLSRLSVEQYRGFSKTNIPKIAKDLNVNFIVVGSGQKYGNKFVLRVQLIAAIKEKQLWGDSYEKEILKTSDIIDLQSQIAQAIASELKAKITPEEKQLFDKIPTTNLTAYYYYLRADAEENSYWHNYLDDLEKQSLKKAQELYNKALRLDPAFALAYTGLGFVYLARHGDDSYLSENYLDTVLILADIALTYDNQMAIAYFLKGEYYFNNGKPKQAIKEYEQAIKYDPKLIDAYFHLASLIYLFDGTSADYTKGIEFLLKAASLNYRENPDIFARLGDAYGYCAGFPEMAKKYYQKAFQLDSDASVYNTKLAQLEILERNYQNAYELLYKNYELDSIGLANIYSMAYITYLLGGYDESFKYLKKIEHKLEAFSPFNVNGFKNIGHIYWQKGYKKEAVHWFNKQKQFSEAAIKFGRFYSANGAAYFDLAGVYSIFGEREKAYENLNEFAKFRFCQWGMLFNIKNDPIFSDIRNEPEFQKIVKIMEAKYQAEHERVRKWLAEQGML